MKTDQSTDREQIDAAPRRARRPGTLGSLYRLSLERRRRCSKFARASSPAFRLTPDSFDADGDLRRRERMTARDSSRFDGLAPEGRKLPSWLKPYVFLLVFAFVATAGAGER